MFSFYINPNIKLLNILPKDPAFDLTVRLQNKETLYVQKAIVSEYSKYFQNFMNLKGISEISLAESLGKPSLISRVFYLIYGETVKFEVQELYDLDRVLEDLDCKKIKEQLKISLKEEILKTESLEFFLKVFDHFALRDHKKFCKESLRRLNEMKFFTSISIEIQGNCPMKILPLFCLLSERGFIKLMSLILQDEIRRRGGEKYKAEICNALEPIVHYYAKEILKNKERSAAIFQDVVLEINPLEKKYFDKDIILVMQGEIQQLKKTNQSLNNQIQGLRAKESENKAKFHHILKRLEKLEGCNNKAVEGEDQENNEKEKEKEKMNEKNNHQQNNKFEEFLANGDHKKGKTKTQAQNHKKTQNNNNNFHKKEETKEIINNSSKQKNSKEITKNPFSFFNNEKELPLLLEFIHKTLETFDKKQVINKIYEGSKNKFSLTKMKELINEQVTNDQSLLVLIRTQAQKSFGAFLYKKPGISCTKEENKSFLFVFNAFHIFHLKSEIMKSEIVQLNEEKFSVGNDLIVYNEGNTVSNSFELGTCFGEPIEENIINNISQNKNFLLKEIIVLSLGYS